MNLLRSNVASIACYSEGQVESRGNDSAICKELAQASHIPAMTLLGNDTLQCFKD